MYSSRDFLIGFVPAMVLWYAASLWRVFTKAGQPGWAALVPIYNWVVLLRIIRQPAWWIVPLLIPGVNVIFRTQTAISLAQSFGRGSWFGLGLAFLGFPFLPILADEDSRYQGAIC